MDFSRFFIDRPIFAAVLSIVIFAAGLIAIPRLPISEYPEVVPPSVVVRTVYPGANPKVIAETVATPLEEAINGVEDMMYVKSVAGSDGVMQMTVTFRPRRCKAATSDRKSPSPEKITKWSACSARSSASMVSSMSILPLILRRPDASVNSFAGLVTTL